MNTDRDTDIDIGDSHIHREIDNVGALIIRIGFWGFLIIVIV